MSARGEDFGLRTRIVFGDGTVARVGELAVGIGARRALVVTDRGVLAAGHTERAERALTAARIEFRRFAGVVENPTSTDVEACLAALGDWPADLLVAVGGGSAIDTAKGCAFLLAGGGSIEDYHGSGKARGRLLPLIAIPTTAGTGSEVQSFALIGRGQTHEKLACGDPQAAPRIAILDPELTLTQPPLVTACSGLDAVGHAVESAVSRARTPFSEVWSIEAFRLLAGGLPRVLASPDDLVARGAVLRGATLAGAAIENSMLGAAHSLANPLTAQHGIPHGQAVALTLPSVVRFNGDDDAAAAGYWRLVEAIGLPGADQDATERLAGFLEDLLDRAGFRRGLRGHGVTESSCASLASEAARQWTAGFNPRSVSSVELAGILTAAL